MDKAVKDVSLTRGICSLWGKDHLLSGMWELQHPPKAGRCIPWGPQMSLDTPGL